MGPACVQSETVSFDVDSVTGGSQSLWEDNRPGMPRRLVASEDQEGPAEPRLVQALGTPGGTEWNPVGR